MRRAPANCVCREDEKRDGEQAKEDCKERRRVLGNVEDIRTSLLRPVEPGDERAEGEATREISGRQCATTVRVGDQGKATQ